jgi:hypothetical protein
MSELDDLLKEVDTLLPNTNKNNLIQDEDTFLNDLSSSIGIDSDLLKAIDKAESGGNNNATSPTGVLGRFQMTRGTAVRYGVKDRTNFQDVATGAAKLVKDLSDKYNNDPEKIFAAYNTGEGVVDEAISKAQQTGEDWKTKIKDTDALNDVVLSIMKAKQALGNETKSFSEEKNNKLKEIESHRNNILKYYTKNIENKFSNSSIDNLLKESDNILGINNNTSIDNLLGKTDELLQNKPKEEFVGPLQPKQKPFIGDIINSTKNIFRQMLITVPSILASSDLKKDNEEINRLKEKLNLTKDINKQNSIKKQINKKQEYIKTIQDFRNLSKTASTKGSLAEKEVQRLPGIAGFLQDVTSAGTQLVGQIGTTALSPSLGMYMITSQIGGNTVETLNKYNISDEEALPLAILNSAIQIPLERVGLGSITKSLVKNSAPIIKKVLTGAIGEGSTEAIQQIPDDILGQLWGESKGKNIGERINYITSNWKRLLKNAGYAGLISFVTGGTTSVVGSGISKIGEQKQEQQNIPQSNQELSQPVQSQEQTNDVSTRYQEADEKTKELLRIAFPEDMQIFDQLDQQRSPTQQEIPQESIQTQETTQTIPNQESPSIGQETSLKQEKKYTPEQEATLARIRADVEKKTEEETNSELDNYVKKTLETITTLEKNGFDVTPLTITEAIYGRENTGEVGNRPQTTEEGNLSTTTIQESNPFQTSRTFARKGEEVNDKENQPWLRSNIGEGQTNVQKESIKETSSQTPSTSGILQTSSEVTDYIPTEQDKQKGKDLASEVKGVSFNGVWGTQDKQLLMFTLKQKDLETSITIPLSGNSTDLVQAIKNKKLEYENAKKLTKSEATTYGMKAAKVDRLAESNPLIAKTIEGMTIKEKAELADNAQIAKKIQLETNVADTDIQKQREESLNKLSSGFADHTPELERSLKDITGSQKKFDKVFEVIQGEKGKTILVKDPTIFEELRGGESTVQREQRIKRQNIPDQNLKEIADEENINYDLNEENIDDIDNIEFLNKNEKLTTEKNLTDEQKNKAIEQIRKDFKLGNETEIRFADIVRDKKGKVIYLTGKDSFGPAFKTKYNGKNVIFVSNKFNPEKLQGALTHEVSHIKRGQILEQNNKYQNLAEDVESVFLEDQDSEFMKDIDERYTPEYNRIIKEQPIEDADASIEELRREEWLAERVREIVDQKKNTPIHIKIINAIKNYIKRTLGLESTDERLDRIVNKYLQSLKKEPTLSSEGSYSLKNSNKARPNAKKYNKKERLATFTKDWIGLHVSGEKVSIKDLKVRFFDFAMKHLYDRNSESYRKQLFNEINKIKKIDDDAHKKSLEIINEFHDWQEARSAYTKVASFEHFNRKILQKENDRNIKKVVEIINSIKKDYESFEDYQTLKRLYDRVTVTRPRKKESTELTKPGPNYQRLLDKKFIIYEHYQVKQEDGSIKNIDQYKLTDNGKEHIIDLKKYLTNENGIMFNSSDIISKLNDAKNQLKEIRESIKEIKNEVKTERQTVSENIIKQLQSKKDAPENISLLKKITNGLKTVKYYTIDNLKSLTNTLDNYTNGAFSVIQKKLRNAISDESKFKYEMRDFLRDKLSSIPFKNLIKYSPAFKYGILSPITKKTNTDIVVWKTSNGDIELNRSQRVALYMYSKNQNAMRHILEGGISLKKDSPKVKKINNEDFNTLLNSITSEEKQIANVLFEYFEKQGKKINEISNNDVGYDLASEEFYLPLLVRSDMIKKDLKDITNLEQIQQYMKASNPSVLNARIKSNQPIILEGAFESTARTSFLVEKYVGLMLPSKEISNILRDIDEIMIQKGLTPELHILKKIINNIQMPNNYDENNIVYSLDNLFIPATLGYNIPVSLMQPISALMYYTQTNKTSLTNLPKAILSLKNSRRILEKVMKYSPNLRDRYEGNMVRDIFEHSTSAKVRSITGVSHKGIRKLFSSEGAMTPITWGDIANTIMIWTLSEQEISNKNPNLKKDSEELDKLIIKQVENVIENTQPIYDVLDKPIALNVPFLRPVTYFTSQPIKNAQIVFKSVGQIVKGIKNKDGQMLFEGTKNLLITSIIQPLAVESIRLSWRAFKGTMDEDEYKDGYAWLKKIIQYNILNMGLIGNLIGAAFSDYTNTPWGGPIGTLSEQITGLIKDTINGLEEGMDSEQIVKHLDKIGNLTIIGKKAIQDLIKGFTNILENN